MADLAGEGAELNITIVQGATFVLPFHMYNATTEADINLTGAQIKAQIRKKADATDIIATLNSPDEFVITDAAGGEFVLTIPASVTSTFPTGTYKWDLFIKYADSRVSRVVYGECILEANITEPSSD